MVKVDCQSGRSSAHAAMVASAQYFAQKLILKNNEQPNLPRSKMGCF